MQIKFIFVGEGSSDSHLVEHIETLLIEMGVNEVSGEAPNLRQFPEYTDSTVRTKLDVICKHFPSADLIFVHRDADNAGRERRLAEIEGGAGHERMDKIVPVIPQVALESWLLADVQEIKNVAGSPNARGNLGLPNSRAIERTANPKECLRLALGAASGLSGRHLDRFNRRFSDMRYRLTTALKTNGPVTRLESYSCFRRDLEAVLAKILTP